MVQKKDTKFQCEQCGMFFKDQETAKKCEDWCTEHKSCNLDIIKHVVEQ